MSAEPRTMPLRRIVIIGLSGAGKTTLAAHLAGRLQLVHIEIDALNWGPNWQAAPKEELIERVRAAAEAADGNYSAVRGVLWPLADTIIWLDYLLWFVLCRLWQRTWSRVFGRIRLWNGNRETLRGALFSRDSLFFYVLRVYRRRSREYGALFAA